MNQKLQILIFGGGSVGLGLASCLIKSGADVTIAAREKTSELLHREGLFRTGIFGNDFFESSLFKAVSSVDQVKDCDFDYILVCVKSYDTNQAADSLLPWKNRSNFILCQNGYGNRELFLSRFPDEQVFIGRVITGFRRPAPNSVDITVHASPIRLGHPDNCRSDILKNLSDLITTGGIPTEVSSDIMKDLWAKILYNVLLNPLGAILNVPYGALGESKDTIQIMNSLAKETFKVMRLHGFQTYWSDADSYLKIFFNKLLPPTVAHESSMLQDLRAGRKTEIDVLNGAIVRLAKEKKLEVPVNECICGMIRFLTSKGE